MFWCSMAVRRWSHFQSTLKSGVYVGRSDCSPAAFISSNVALARSHCPPLSCAVMRALYVKTLDFNPAFDMLAHSSTASLQRWRRASWEIYAL